MRRITRDNTISSHSPYKATVNVDAFLVPKAWTGFLEIENTLHAVTRSVHPKCVPFGFGICNYELYLNDGSI